MAKKSSQPVARMPASPTQQTAAHEVTDSPPTESKVAEGVAAPVSVPFVSCLLLLSGACALVYQTAWLREFHLVFGGTTAASGAVLSIFMAGLGIGNLVFGRRADRVRQPLAFYGVLEIGIALSVACSPWLIDGIRAVYASVGGQMSLGLAGATALRLLLSCAVIILPTMLMGGTLPAAVRAVIDPRDTRRRSLAFLYGFNTLGAVAGAGLSTFVLLESWGTRKTLWVACLVNLFLSVVAIIKSRRNALNPPVAATAPTLDRQRRPQARNRAVEVQPEGGLLPSRFVYFAAAVVGFAFFLMEIVWYRVLSPLLGGTTFAFGIILAVALSGIGLGGLLWGPVSKRIRATASSFAISCGLEALLMAIPFALGDRIAMYAAESRLKPIESFAQLVGSWTVITMVVVFPAAVVSGLQFPLLVSLLGEGRDKVGRQLGQAFACNTIGCILGSLIGGFGLLPLLSSNGVWSASVISLCILGLLTVFVGHRSGSRRVHSFAAVGLIGGAIACLFAIGPTTVWRHGGIGAARVAPPGKTPNEQIEWLNSIRRRFMYETDGVEASIAIESSNGYAFYVNGKSDGNSVGDAGTQIMLGVLPAWLHDGLKTALCIGLGTGESAGWLAEVPTIEQVDCVELEPAIDEMARICAPVNFDVLNHPKVKRTYTDAREVLVSTAKSYDLILSEPSNPFRAGIANLFTREFYQSVDHRLNEGGLFVQWMQAYEVDQQTLRTVFATLTSVFDNVQVWQTMPSDLFLVCSREPLVLSESKLRERLKQHPFREAAVCAWRSVDLEGVLGRYLAGDATIRKFAGSDAEINTDDRNVIEYGFARTLGRHDEEQYKALREMAVSIGDTRLNLDGVDWNVVGDHQQMVLSVARGQPYLPSDATPVQRERERILELYRQGQTEEVVRRWRASKRELQFPDEHLLYAIACANLRDAESLQLADKLATFSETEANAVRAFYYVRTGELDKATNSMEQMFNGLRTNPWTSSTPFGMIIRLASDVTRRNPASAQKIWNALEEPFMASAFDLQRRVCRMELSSVLGSEAMAESFAAFEPHPLWDERYLQSRAQSYRAAKHPLANRAEADLELFRRNQGGPTLPSP